MQEFLEIGQIVNTFGIKGMVKVKPFTDDITRFDKLDKVYVESNKTKKQYEIEEVKYHKDMVLIKFKGIDRVEDAELLRNSYLKVNRQDEPELEEGTYYIVDLIGLDVYSDKIVAIAQDCQAQLLSQMVFPITAGEKTINVLFLLSSVNLTHNFFSEVFLSLFNSFTYSESYH